jgi:hypothetical protein
MEALELDPASEEIRSAFMQCTTIKKKESLSFLALILDATGALSVEMCFIVLRLETIYLDLCFPAYFFCN